MVAQIRFPSATQPNFDYTVITYQDDDGDGDSEEKTKIGDHAEFLQKLFEPDWVALPFAKPCSQLEEPSSKILSRNFC